MEKPAPAVRGRFFQTLPVYSVYFLCISSALCRLEPVRAEAAGPPLLFLRLVIMISASMFKSVGIETVDGHDEPGGRCQMGVGAVLPGRTVEEAEAGR